MFVPNTVKCRKFMITQRFSQFHIDSTETKNVKFSDNIFMLMAYTGVNDLI